MNSISKKYSEKLKLVNKSKKYSIDEGLNLAISTAWAKFPESIDLAIKVNISSKKSESVRGLVVLPHGTGKTKKVAVLAKGDKLKEAEEASADVFGAEDLVEKITKGFLDFDVLLATPDMMPTVGRLGKILGTKGLMPNPKSGTVTNDIKKSVSEFKSGKTEFRMEKNGVVHLGIGKVNFGFSKLKENLVTAIEAIKNGKPSSVKGEYFHSVSISTTMGPGIKLDVKASSEENE